MVLCYVYFTVMILKSGEALNLGSMQLQNLLLLTSAHASPPPTGLRKKCVPSPMEDLGLVLTSQKNTHKIMPTNGESPFLCDEGQQ